MTASPPADHPADHPAQPSVQDTAGERSPATGINYGTIHTGDTVMDAPVVLPPPAQVPVPAGLHNLPRPPGHPFVGREKDMNELKRALSAAPAGAGQVITQFMSGLGGVGKTTLALQYAHAHQSAYTGVWWLNAQSPETVTDSLAALATRANPGVDTGRTTSTVLEGWALAWLETHPGWLLVFDNATHPDHLNPYLTRLNGSNHLITSRRTEGWHHLTAGPLHLAVLDKLSATSLLIRLTGRDRPHERPDAEHLAAELGHLPLALEQAGAYIRRTRGNYARYLDRFRNQTAKMLATPGSGDPHATTIAGTWRVTLQTIAERDPQAVRLLQAMAWYAPRDIPRSLLNSLDDEPGAVEEALALLNDFSMITLNEDTADIHRLVQAVARTPDDSDPTRTARLVEEARTAATGALNDTLPDGDPDTQVADWPRWRALLPHIDALATHTNPLHDNPDTNGVLHLTSHFLSNQGQLGQALTYAERSAVAAARLYGESSPEALASRNNLAHAYLEAGHLERTIQLYEQILTATEQTLGRTDPETLTSRNNLAYAYQSGGDLKRAIPLLERVLAEREEVLGRTHSDTLTSRNNLAGAYDSAGDLERAIPLFERTLVEREEILGRTHPDTLASRNNLAYAYDSAGDIGRAIPLYQQTLALREEILGNTHPDTLSSRSNLAAAYDSAGDLERAIPLSERTLAEREEILGRMHPGTLTSRNNLACAYESAGDFKRAIQLLERVVAEREEILGHTHPDTLTSRNNLAYAYESAGDFKRAIPLFERTLAEREEVLGRTHPDTRVARENLAQARSHLDRTR